MEKLFCFFMKCSVLSDDIRLLVADRSGPPTWQSIRRCSTCSHLSHDIHHLEVDLSLCPPVHRLY